MGEIAPVKGVEIPVRVLVTVSGATAKVGIIEKSAKSETKMVRVLARFNLNLTPEF